MIDSVVNRWSRSWKVSSVHPIHLKSFSRQPQLLSGKNSMLSIVSFQCWRKRTFERSHLVSISISLPSKYIFSRILSNKISQSIYPRTFQTIISRSSSIWIHNWVMRTTKWSRTSSVSTSSFIFKNLLYNNSSWSATSTYSWMVLHMCYRMSHSWLLCSCDSTIIVHGSRKGDSTGNYSSTLYHSTS